MIVNTQKEIEFVNDCGALVDYSELSKAIIWYQDKPTARLKHIYMHCMYPTVSIHKKKIHVHRLLMMYWTQNKNIGSDIVHHTDGNKLNSMRWNLCIMKANEHGRMHNENKTISIKQRKRISECNRLRRGKKRRPTRPDVTRKEVIELIESGLSMTATAKRLNTTWNTIRRRMNEIHDKAVEE